MKKRDKRTNKPASKELKKVVKRQDVTDFERMRLKYLSNLEELKTRQKLLD